MVDENVKIEILQSIGDIAPADWDACANPVAPSPNNAEMPRVAAPAEAKLQQADSSSQEADKALQEDPHNPFLSHAFLSALERSKSVDANTGWLPQHLAIQDPAGCLRGAAPCYLKSHSRGEYVFDSGWAEAYENAGGRYYPKLQVAVPFTPVTGRRLLVADPADETTRDALIAGLMELCRLRGASSVHFTFPTEAEWRLLGTRGFLQRMDHQFHWTNNGYGSFDDFLAALAARKRKAVQRERREALAPGIEIEWLTGSDLTESVWDTFFAFYMDTGSRKWGRPYLTRAFFSLIGAAMPERILLVMAKRAGRYIAGAINFIGDRTLYGRHWGATEHHPFLHFEICYYQAMAFAIERKLARVEAGAQGEHKLSRGYLPTATYSAHYIADPGLRKAIAAYLSRERAYVSAAGEELAEMAPFRKDLA